MDDQTIVDICEKLILSCGLEIDRVRQPELSKNEWIATFSDESYLIRVLLGSEMGRCYPIATTLEMERGRLGCKSALLLSGEILPRAKLEYFSRDCQTKVIDARTIGAHLSALLDEQAATDFTSSNVHLGHFRLEGSELYRSADIMVYMELEGGLLHFVGQAQIGNLRAGGPNMGTFDFIAADLTGHVPLFWNLPMEIPSQSAAQFGDLVVFEVTSEFSQDRYQAKFRFTKYGIVVVENQSIFTPYGFSVYFSGHYERAIFPSLEKSRFEIDDSEIEDLANNFRGVFRSFQVGTIEIKAWLEQFAPDERRPMLYLLRQVRFYNSLVVREAIFWLHQKFINEFNLEPDNQGQLLITTFGSPAKSGPSLSRIYRQENQLLSDQVVSSFEIEEATKTNQAIKFIICPEDIVGSGQDMINFLRGVNGSVGKTLSERNITVVIQIVCALKDGLEALEQFRSQLAFKTKVYCYELAEKCFSRDPDYTSIDEDWVQIKAIADSYGKRLRPDKSLGYENSQMLAVFYDNCPNNTLPILWASSRESDFYWNALFPRE